MDIAEPDQTPPVPSPPPAPRTSSDERAAAEALVDEEAADIDARDPDAAERIAELAEEAGDLGLPAEPDRVGPPPGDRSGG
jgi:hypothetical protein